MNFGELEAGEIATKRITVDNIGGSASELNFNIVRGVRPFRIIDVSRVSDKKSFPVLVTVEASCDGLSVGQSHIDYLQVDLDGVTAQVTLEVKVLVRDSDPWKSGKVTSTPVPGAARVSPVSYHPAKSSTPSVSPPPPAPPPPAPQFKSKALKFTVFIGLGWITLQVFGCLMRLINPPFEVGKVLTCAEVIGTDCTRKSQFRPGELFYAFAVLAYEKHDAVAVQMTLQILAPDGKPVSTRNGISSIGSDVTSMAYHQSLTLPSGIPPGIYTAQIEMRNNETGQATKAQNTFSVVASDQRAASTSSPAIPDERAESEPTRTGIMAALKYRQSFRGEKRDSNRHMSWPVKFNFSAFDERTGHVEGQVEYTTLNTVIRFQGDLSGETLKLIGTDYVRPGGAALGLIYSLSFTDNGKMGGSWKNNDGGSSGTIWLKLG